MLAYVTRNGSSDLHIGRMRISQSTFMVAAAVVVGAGGGLGAVVFRAMIGATQSFAFGVVGANVERYAGAAGLVVQLAAGGALAAFLAVRFAPEARGHGVPEVMEAVALRGGKMRPRVIAVKSVASALSIGFGGSCGREGPIVQIGSAIGSVLGQALRAPLPIVRTLVACGAAAGISATFNAPIGGVFFAAEVILGDFAPRSFAAIVVASVVAAVIGRALLGNHPSFNAAGFVLVSPWELVLYAVLGCVAALWATGFVNLLYFVEDGFDRLKWPHWLKGAFGFACVGALGIWFPQVLGVGYGPIQHVLDEHVPPAHAFALAVIKPLATAFTLGAGGSGGVFAPSLFTGAFLGDAFGRVAHAAFPAWTGPAAAYGLVAMAAVFSAAAEAPITAIVIVFEMSDDYTIVLPLMVTVVIATLLGRKLLGTTIYERKLIRRGVDWQQARHPRFFSKLTVSSVVRTPPAVAQADVPIQDILDGDGVRIELAMPVCEGERYLGIVTAADLARAALHRADEPVRAILRTTPERLHLGDSLERAAVLLSDSETPLLPVTGVDDDRLLGVVTRRDLLDAYGSSSGF